MTELELEVARFLAAPQIDPRKAAEVMDAVEGYELASARFEWAKACHVDPAHEQPEAMEWHNYELRTSQRTMLTRLRQVVGAAAASRIAQAS